jgi:ankyrin repeat protein
VRDFDSLPCGCHSISHRFRWISHRLNSLLPLPENPLLQASDILEKVGTPRDEEDAQALEGIPEEKSHYAVRLFQCMVAAIPSHPFKLKELAAISAELDSNAGPDHERAVLSVCPTLVGLDEDDRTIVKFSHESVKKYLKSSRLRNSGIEKRSRYHVTEKAAEVILARICIKVLLQFDKNSVKKDLEGSPLAFYAAQYWVRHTLQARQAQKVQQPEENAAPENQDVMVQLFDPSKSHLEAWIWMHDVDKDRSRKVEDLDEHPPHRKGTPLYYVALCGFAELVKSVAYLRLEDLHDGHGHYGIPLHAALYKGHEDAVLALLESDTDTKVQVVDKKVKNKTPLHAAYYGKQKLGMMKLLLEKGADVDAKGAKGNTLLHCASLDGEEKVVELLLKYEPKINAKNDNGWTPLHRAALRGRLDVAKLILEFKPKDEKEKPDVDTQSKKGNTPLHVASIAGKREMVELLLNCNANRNIGEEHGWLPYDVAEKNGHAKIADLLSPHNRWASELRRRLRRYGYPGS